MEAAEVWSASGSDPLSAFASPRALRRTFDAGVKGYVAELPAGGPPRPSLPVALRHPALVLQVFVPGSGALSLELSCTDAGGSRRRLAFSTAFVELNGKGLVAQVPLPLPRGRWLNVLLHVSELLTALYAGSQLRSIDLITLGCVPQLRRIFTLRDAPSGTEAAVPRALDLPSGADVVVIDSRASGRGSQGSGSERGSPAATPVARTGPPRRASSMGEAAPAVAFGRRLRAHSSGSVALPSPSAAPRPGSCEAVAGRGGAAEQSRWRGSSENGCGATASPRASLQPAAPHASPPGAPTQQALQQPPTLALPPPARPRPPRLQLATSPTRPPKASPAWGDDSAGSRGAGGSEGATPLSPGSAQSRYGSLGSGSASATCAASPFSAISPAVAAAAAGDDAADVMSLRALMQRTLSGGIGAGAPSPPGAAARSRASSGASSPGSGVGPAAASGPPSPPGSETRSAPAATGHAWLSSPTRVGGPGPLSPLRWQAAAAAAVAALAQRGGGEAVAAMPPAPASPPAKAQTASPHAYSPTGWVPPAALWQPAAPPAAGPVAVVIPPGGGKQAGLTRPSSWLTRSDEGGPSTAPAWAAAEAAAAQAQAAAAAAAAATAAARARPASAHVAGAAPRMTKVPSLSQIASGWRGSRRAEDADAIELGSASEGEEDGFPEASDEPCGLPSPQPGAPPRRVASDAASEASEPSPDGRPRGAPFAGSESSRRSSSDGERSIVFDAVSGLYVDPATGAMFQELHGR